MKLKHLISLAVLSCSALQVAQAQAVDNIFRKFSQCDAGFFKAMKQESQIVQALAPTDSVGEALWFKVPNRNAENNGMTLLTGNPAISGLPVLSYLDEVSDLGSLGRFYYWGFKVKGTQIEVLEKLKPLVHESERLRRDTPVYVRTELNTDGVNWVPVKTASGLPKAGTVERAFLFETDDKDNNITKVFCSLQGSVTAEHLKALRPDIDVKEYPVAPKVISFEDSVVDRDLIARLQQSVLQQPLFMPKFKRVIVTYKTVSAKSSVFQTDTLVHRGGGLIDVHEDLKFIGFKRQNIAGLVQTKYAYIKADKKIFKGVSIAKEGIIEVAKSLTKGELAFKSSATSIFEPAEAGDKASSLSRSCMAGETVAASTILQSLQGQALLLSCNFSGEKPYTSGFALILDLGLLLHYELPETQREYKPIYTSITIEQ